MSSVLQTFEQFAKADVYVGDIDPTYWAINRAAKEFGWEWAVRFCVGMLVYYHTGTAAQAADLEGPAFWNGLINAYDTAPRAAERRHFRGSAGMDALKLLQKKFPNPDTFFDDIPRTYNGLVNYCVQQLIQFGPYFQLKIADYMDRCLGMPINQESMVHLGNNLPTLPAKALILLYPQYRTPRAFHEACKRVYALGMLAPPSFDRPIGPAEVETILCDWKRAKSGSSWMGADVADKRAAFQGFGGRAAAMAEWMPPSINQYTFKLDLK